MSWNDFKRLIDEQNSEITAWMHAIEANPNTPEDALKLALLHAIQQQDMAALDKFATLVLYLVRNADSLLDALIDLETAEIDNLDAVVVSGMDDWMETAATELPW